MMALFIYLSNKKRMPEHPIICNRNELFFEVANVSFFVWIKAEVAKGCD